MACFGTDTGTWVWLGFFVAEYRIGKEQRGSERGHQWPRPTGVKEKGADRQTQRLTASQLQRPRSPCSSPRQTLGDVALTSAGFSPRLSLQLVSGLAISSNTSLHAAGVLGPVKPSPGSPSSMQLGTALSV